MRFCAISPLHHTCRTRIRAGMSLHSTRRVTHRAQAAVCVQCAHRRSVRRARTSLARARGAAASRQVVSAGLSLVRQVVVSSSAAEQRDARATEFLQRAPPRPAASVMSMARHRIYASGRPVRRRRRRSETCSAHGAQLAATPNLRRCAPAAWRCSTLTSSSAAELHALDLGARRGCARCSTPSPPGGTCANADVVLDMPAQNSVVQALSPNSPALASMMYSCAPATNSA